MTHSHTPIKPNVKKATFWYHQKFLKYIVETLLILTIILVFSKVSVVLTPVVDFISILAAPVILSIAFYYLLRPVIHFMAKMHIPRFLSILLIYIILGGLLAFFFIYMGPIIVEQVTSLASNSVETLETIKFSSKSIMLNYFNLNLDHEIETRIVALIQQVTTLLSKNLLDFVGVVTRIATILAVIPFIVFYLLKDDVHITSSLLGKISRERRRPFADVLHSVDNTLSSYIQGLVIVSTSVGFMLFIGYWIIGLKYALILSLIAVIFTTIPFVGPFIAITPAILVGLTDSPFMVVKVVSVFMIVQQTEANIISPLIIGQRLHIHPLTIILLLMAAGSLYGLVGLILATPVYAVTKVLVVSLYKIYLLRSSNWRRSLAAPAER